MNLSLRRKDSCAVVLTEAVRRMLGSRVKGTVSARSRPGRPPPLLLQMVAVSLMLLCSIETSTFQYSREYKRIKLDAGLERTDSMCGMIVGLI